MWQNHYGAPTTDEYLVQGYQNNARVMQGSDGNYIFPGTTTDFGNGDQFILKVDGYGNPIWDFHAGYPLELDNSYATIKTFDNSYFVAGDANFQSINVNDIRLTKFTESGDVIFSKIILTDSLNPAIPHDICYTKDSNYIAACASALNVTLVAFDTNGDTLWVNRPLPDSIGSAVPLYFQPSPDFSAYYGVVNNNTPSYYWFKTDTAGLLLDIKQIQNPGQPNVQVHKAQMLPNGHLVVLGSGQSDLGNMLCIGTYYFLFEYNFEGQIVRQKILCYDTWEFDPNYNLLFTDFIIGIDSSIYFPMENRIFKLDADWEPEWVHQFNIMQGAQFMILSQFQYGYLIAGGQMQVSPGNLDMYLCKIALPEATGINYHEEETGLKVYPNPANDYLSIDVNSTKPWYYSVLDTKGSVHLMGSSNQKKEIDISHLSEGLYFLQIQVESKFLVEKIIID